MTRNSNQNKPKSKTYIAHTLHQPTEIRTSWYRKEQCRYTEVTGRVSHSQTPTSRAISVQWNNLWTSWYRKEQCRYTEVTGRVSHSQTPTSVQWNNLRTSWYRKEQCRYTEMTGRLSHSQCQRGAVPPEVDSFCFLDDAPRQWCSSATQWRLAAQRQRWWSHRLWSVHQTWMSLVASDPEPKKHTRCCQPWHMRYWQKTPTCWQKNTIQHYNMLTAKTQMMLTAKAQRLTTKTHKMLTA